MNDYQRMIQAIRVPDGLNEAVLAAVRGNPATSPHRRRPLVRTAVCAALALALVVGGIQLCPADIPGDPQSITAPAILSVSLTASAAGANGALAFTEDGGFCITGEGIETVTLSVDRGTLTCDGMPLEKDTPMKHDPEAIYGFQAEPETPAVLTVTAASADGTEHTLTYHLTAETLQAFRNEDGSEVLVPGLTGETQAGQPGVYAAPAESRWLLWPVGDSRTVSLSAPYGLRHDGGYFHSGIDIPSAQGTAVYAAAAGTVLEADFDTQRGSCLLLEHENGLTTLYAHCQEVLVTTGDSVSAGDTIALVGATGMATGPHLHFEVRQDGEAQQPVAYFPAEIRATLSMG